jgi:predicted DsbA family dithiol-disulfide isomerase
VLIDAAKAAGMDPDLVENLLRTDEDLADVRAEDAQAREIGVTGVPTFIVAEQYALQGSQTPETWARVIAEMNEGA